MRSTLGVTVRLTAGLIVAMSWAAPAGAAPGDLDGSFSGDGWVRTLEVRTETNNYLPKGAEDLAIQPDGKVVAVGELQDGSSYWYFGVFRYLPGGELDPGFGDGGWVATELGSFPFAHAVALQPDGKIVVAGEGTATSLAASSWSATTRTGAWTPRSVRETVWCERCSASSAVGVST